MQEEELEQEADLAKAEQAARSETLRDTAPVIDASKVPPAHLVNETLSGRCRLAKQLPRKFNTNPELHHLLLYNNTY